MEVLLLGTGGPGGWPQPGCRCASCACAAARRLSRAPTSALVDDVLLLDPTQELARQAAQVGRGLSRVRTVLLSGQQPPPRSLLGALGAEGPVEVLGPAAALDTWPGDAAVQPVPVTAGQVVRKDGYVLGAVAQGHRIGWEVSSSRGPRMLYAPGVDPAGGGASDLPPYDAVLLGGGASAPGLTLAALRRAGALTGKTDVVVVGIGHDDGHPDAVAERLRAWGARAVPDGTLLHVGGEAAVDGEARPLRGRTLVLGGVRSGKSALAEQLMAAQPSVLYVATGGTRDDDAEWRERVAAHVARRPATWQTLETTDLATCLASADRPLLIDCLGTWLTARLDHHGIWDGGPVDAIDRDVAELVRAWRSTPVPVVAVSNEVGSGVVPATASGRLFRDLLGRLNSTVAAESEAVLLCVAGIAVPLRGLESR